MLHLLWNLSFAHISASKSGFSVATPNDIVDTHEFETTPPNSPYKFPSSISHSIKLKRQSSLHQNRNTQKYHQPQSDLLHRQPHSAKHSPNYDLIKQSSDPLHSTFVADSLTYSSNGLKQQQQQMQSQSQSQSHQPPPPSPQPQSQHRRQSISNEAASEISTATTTMYCDSSTTDTSRPSSSDRRRQVMNITSNPSYQVNNQFFTLHTNISIM